VSTKVVIVYGIDTPPDADLKPEVRVAHYVDFRRNQWNGDLEGAVDGIPFQFKAASKTTIRAEVHKAERRLAAWKAIDEGTP